jgi:hypothetical protein
MENPYRLYRDETECDSDDWGPPIGEFGTGSRAAAAGVTVVPLDVEAIAARAQAAPAGNWMACPDMLWIPWHADTDDETDGHWSCSGRWIAIQEGSWHNGSEDPGPELWAFLAVARDDVLSLAAEVRRLRARLAPSSDPNFPGLEAALPRLALTAARLPPTAPGGHFPARPEPAGQPARAQAQEGKS